MVTFSSTRFARAPIQTVFRHATDLRNVPNIVPGIRSIEVLTDGPVRVGTRFKETRVVFGREHSETMEVTAIDPPRACTFSCESGGARYDSRFTFRAKDGGTEIELEVTATPLTFFAKVMGFMMKPMTKMMSKECAKDLDAIVAAAERPSSAL